MSGIILISFVIIIIIAVKVGLVVRRGACTNQEQSRRNSVVSEDPSPEYQCPPSYTESAHNPIYFIRTDEGDENKEKPPAYESVLEGNFVELTVPTADEIDRIVKEMKRRGTSVAESENSTLTGHTNPAFQSGEGDTQGECSGHFPEVHQRDQQDTLDPGASVSNPEPTVLEDHHGDPEHEQNSSMSCDAIHVQECETSADPGCDNPAFISDTTLSSDFDDVSISSYDSNASSLSDVTISSMTDGESDCSLRFRRQSSSVPSLERNNSSSA